MHVYICQFLKRLILIGIRVENILKKIFAFKLCITLNDHYINRSKFLYIFFFFYLSTSLHKYVQVMCIIFNSNPFVLGEREMLRSIINV